MSAFDTSGFESWAEKNDVSPVGDSPYADWPEPEPIRNDLRPVAPLTAEMIPEPLRDYLADIAYRMGCPIDFIASFSIVISSILIGAGCSIKPKRYDDWRVTPNLWGGVIARPGMWKTPALAEALKPLVRLEIAAREEYDDAMRGHEAEVEMHKAQKNALKDDMEKAAKGKGNGNRDLKSEFVALQSPKPPIWRRYRTNNATIEKLDELMAENPRGILYFCDELIGFLMTLDREDRKGDRAFHLQAWNGNGSNITDRIGRGTINTPNLCESVFGGIQPSKLISYLSQAVKNIENDGLIQRFQLMVYPELPQDWQLIDQSPDHEAKNRAFAVFERLAAMDFTAHGATLEEGAKAPHFHFSPDAQRFFYDWLTAHEGKLRRNGEEPIMIEHLAKFRSLMPSLALIFHAIEVTDGTASGPVTLRSAQRAAQWCDYLETHARRIYGLVNDIEIQAAARLASKIQEGAIQDRFTARDVYRKHWGLLDDKELVALALDELELLGWVRKEPPTAPHVPGFGRTPLPVFRINPKVRICSKNEEGRK
jgi:Protein of unknown function (DUF3987)